MAKIELEKYGDGWEFTIDGSKYRTNESGYGRWSYRISDHQWNGDGTPYYEWKQVDGTAQFSLPRDRKAAYQKIYRIFCRKKQGDLCNFL